MKGLLSRIVTLVLFCIPTTLWITSRNHLHASEVAKDPSAYIARQQTVWNHHFTYNFLLLMLTGIFLLVCFETVAWVLRGDWIKVLRGRS